MLVVRRLAVGPQTQGNLGEPQGTSQPHFTLMVDDLERQGPVKRQPHPADRRAKPVELTASGSGAAARAAAILDEPPAVSNGTRDGDPVAVLRVVESIAWR